MPATALAASPRPTPAHDPPTVEATTAGAEDAYTDPSRELGAISPSCRYPLDATARRNCRASGAADQPHPLSAYGMDVRVGFSLTDPGKTFMGALQSLGAALWMALLYLVKAVLLLLEWAFSLDLTNQGMPQASRTLSRIHESVFGDPWLLLAISIAGVWGIWRGLVQRRAAETLSGLAAAVALIVLALVIIAKPAGTVGRAAQIANEGGMAVLAAATTGTVAQPRAALAGALGGVFDSTVRAPWCALEFGSVGYCEQRTGDPQRPTNADVWLAYPAQSWQRGRLHDQMAASGGGFSPLGVAKDLLGLGDNRDLPDSIKRLVHRDPARARMQESGGTFPRLALLATIAVGVLGAAVLYAHLGLRLLLASAMTLLLLLITPAMLLAPALGESGRATFISWAKRLIGAVVAKLVYGVFLAVVLAASTVFAHLGIGWFGTWLLLAAFWWGVFVKRNEIIGFVSAGIPRQEHGGIAHALSHGYYAWMLGRGLRQTAGRSLGPARGGVAALRTRRAETREASAAATSVLARERLDQHGRHVLGGEQVTARGMVERRTELQQELAAVDRRLRGYDESVAAARAANATAPTPTSQQRELLQHRRQLRTLIDDPAAREAVEIARHADRNRALTGDPVSRRDLDAYRARRAAELREGLPLDDERNLRAAGIDPQAYRQADPAQREEMLRQTGASLQMERDLLDAATGERMPATAGVPGNAHRWLDASELRRRTAAERAQLRQERRRRRARNGLFRPR